jgi:hypothetical protein
MIRTLKDATVHRYYYATHQEFKDHLQTYLMAYNLARRLKTLKGLHPSSISVIASRLSLAVLPSVRTITLWD